PKSLRRSPRLRAALGRERTKFDRPVRRARRRPTPRRSLRLRRTRPKSGGALPGRRLPEVLRDRGAPLGPGPPKPPAPDGRPRSAARRLSLPVRPAVRGRPGAARRYHLLAVPSPRPADVARAALRVRGGPRLSHPQRAARRVGSPPHPDSRRCLRRPERAHARRLARRVLSPDHRLLAP